MSDNADTYCRDVEAYLCRKNDGHLVRIVGPAFEQVCGWAARGVPLNAVYRGIDRYFERYYAKGPRRRPVRVEFCEPDVLDVFDEWRRAVGLAGTDTSAGTAKASDAGSLPSHLDRALARLTAVRSADTAALDLAIDEIIRELDAARARAKGLRGHAREEFCARLRELDDRLIDAARAGLNPTTIEQLGAEADRELRPFRDRMAREAYDQARQASLSRLIRDHCRLPVVTFE